MSTSDEAAGGSVEPLLDAGQLVGLLADDDRLRVVAALVLGARDLPGIRAVTGLDARAAGRAVTRLVDSELVVTDQSGEYQLVAAAFALAARAAAPEPSELDEHADAPPDEARVLRAFVRDGRLLSIPTARAKRLIVLDLVAQEFEPGERYSEPMVNLILGRWHADTAALRRYLVDEQYLSREGGEYWRTGGTVL